MEWAVLLYTYVNEVGGLLGSDGLFDAVLAIKAENRGAIESAVLMAISQHSNFISWI